ncbi:hypothetical protein BJY01DRAFT_252079 [Aspergillus pseudoustus]|uniref:Uncharacterized protein n=1 Tax=Aspergillus pseudoustus TaxID=1810923 RepID=A0ABR4J811_9EURO
MPAVVVTLGDLTFLDALKITHARLTNLFSLLACSALHLTLPQPLPNDTKTDRPVEHWRNVTNQAFAQATEHLQPSLKNELGPAPKTAEYKDQPMALHALTEVSNISGQAEHTRCLLLDSERLVRPRGFIKRKLSQKARFVHHVYTWHRIVGESTYVLHDYTPSGTFLHALHPSRLADEHTARVTAAVDDFISASRLDNFLRLETNPSGRDLNINERKDKQTSLKDIHLERQQESCLVAWVLITVGKAMPYAIREMSGPAAPRAGEGASFPV